MARREPGEDPKAAALRKARCLNPHPEQVSDPAFLSGEFFDARDMVQVKYEMVRAVAVDKVPSISAGLAPRGATSSGARTAPATSPRRTSRASSAFMTVTVQTSSHTLPRRGPSAERPRRIGGSVCRRRAAVTLSSAEIFGDLKLFEPKTRCPFLAVRDREEH
jgi:hypothetical protein